MSSSATTAAAAASVIPAVSIYPVPPAFKDIAKAASDLLSKDYPVSGGQIEVKTKTPSGVTFKVAGTKDAKSNDIHADIEGKYTDVKNGVTLTNTWTTANLLKSQVELDNHLAKGLKFDLLTTLAPESKKKSVHLGSVYKQPGVHARAYVDLLKTGFAGPHVHLDTVVGRDGVLAGAQAAYSVSEGAISSYAATVGYVAPSYAVTLQGLGNLSTFALSYYHRVNRDVEAGAKAVYDTKHTKPGMALEFGAKMYLDNAAYVKAKINNAGVLALGYTQALRPGVKASFGLALDTQKINDTSAVAPAHKVGTSLTFEA